MNAIIRLASVTPSPLKRWLYRHPRLLKPLASRLKKAMPADGFTIVTIPGGPNKGMKLAVNRSTPNYYWVNDAYEPHVLEVLKTHIRPGMIVLDIGAHIGFDTLLLSRLVGETGKVIAFEPDPANFQWLDRNCELNRLANVTLNRQAVSDTAGALAFAADGLTTSHLSAQAPDNPSTIQVETLTLDQWARQAGLIPDLVKIDVEDHEPAVLRGAEELLRTRHPTLLIEIHSPESLADCLAQLQSLEYSLHPLPEDSYYRAVLSGEASDPSAFTIAHLLAEPRQKNP